MQISKLSLILFCFFTLSIHAFSTECTIRKDTLYYIEIDIRSRFSYPIIMSGVLKRFDLVSFSKDNSDAFLKSFYTRCHYVPDLYRGISNMFVDCMGVNDGGDFINTYKHEGEKIMNLLSENSIKEIFYLDSGEIIFISVVQISASFWVVGKNCKGLVANSNEPDINSIEEIYEVYVPYKIDYYKKIEKREFKNIFKLK